MGTLPRNYAHLAPTVLTAEEVHRFLWEILAAAEQEDVPASEVAGAFVEMLVRLSDSYGALDESLGRRIFAWVESRWTEESLEVLDRLCTVLANLPYPETRAFVLERIEHAATPQVRALLTEVRDELDAE